jgi:hypothetical protein
MGRVKWFPTRQPLPTKSNNIQYYALPDDTVWMPFHSMNGANPGHLVWDDFLPMYTLLDMFQLLPSLREKQRALLLPMRQVLARTAVDENGQEQQLRGLWASCDVRPEKKQECQQMMTKFMPLLVGKDYPYQFSSTQDFQLVSKNSRPTVDLVCAKHGVAGIASLTDHGVNKLHGWVEEDYMTTHNHGRGGSLYAFRNFMMQNMGMETKPVLPAAGGHRIVFSQNSSDIYIRKMDFETQIQLSRWKRMFLRTCPYKSNCKS